VCAESHAAREGEAERHSHLPEVYGAELPDGEEAEGMTEPSAPPAYRLVFQVGVSPEGKLTWQSALTLGELCLLLGRIRLELETGQVKQVEPAIVPADKGALAELDRLTWRTGPG
jgi:hypothetical protein